MNNETDHPTRLHAVVSGFVQGVGFRAYVLEHAIELNLTGWVRNTYEGDVEVTAEGPRRALEDLYNFLRRGPRGAFVSEVSQEWSQAEGEFTRFEVRQTA
jgi:acylphosphatase